MTSEMMFMEELIISVAVGVLLAILGIINMTGNVSSVHWYHRKRITEENIKPFGRFVGVGTVLIGVSVLIFGILNFICSKNGNQTLAFIAIAELIFGTVCGIAISFYAMIKYNKGIF